MAGNKNSGRTAGKSLPELIQSACRRAIKQGNAGLDGQRALADLLAEQMQVDPLAFLRTVAPYCPKEVFIDYSISITSALEQARSRVINMGQAEVITDQTAITPLMQLDSIQSDDQSTVLCDAPDSQGGA
jgi:hypothetical protein